MESSSNGGGDDSLTRAASGDLFVAIVVSAAGAGAGAGMSSGPSMDGFMTV